MRDMNDLKNAFGQADDGFVRNVYRTLDSIQTNMQRKPVKKTGFRMVAVIAIVCILSCGTVLAFTNTWGILDFLSERRNGAKVLPEAAEMVQKDISQKGNQTEFAAFVVREAVFDGKNIFIVVDAKPSSPEYLLLGPDVYPSDPIGNMGPLFSGKTGTIADYARENNKEMINTSVGIDGANCSIDYLLEDDGTLVYMISGNYSGSSAQSEIEMTCVAVPFVNRGGKDVRDMSNKKETTLSVILENSGTKGAVTSTVPVVYSDCGVRVDKITLTGSAMAIYADIEFTVIDKEKYAKADGGFWFEFVDEDGNRVPSGASSGEGIIEIDEDHFIQKVTLQASETLPDKVVLRGYNGWDKNRYETHTFEMK